MSEKQKFRIIIIGGGLGGLALANGLVMANRQEPDLNLEVEIYERNGKEVGEEDHIQENEDDENGESQVIKKRKKEQFQGYRIGLDGGGLRGLRACHLQQKLDDSHLIDGDSLRSVKIGTVIRGRNYLPLLSFPLSEGGLVNRWLLHRLLKSDPQIAANYHYHKKCLAIRNLETGGVRVDFEDGTFAVGDLLIGADGVNSVVRKHFCPQLQLRDSNVTGLAGIVAMKELQQHSTQQNQNQNQNENQNQNSRTGGGVIAQNAEGSLLRVYGPEALSWLFLRYTNESTHEPMMVWVLNHNVETSGWDYPDDCTDPATWKVKALEWARKGHPDIAAIVEETPVDRIMAPRHQFHLDSELLRRNPFAEAAKTWPRIALLGDAAHAMTTHRGLGANTAFEDAADLLQAILPIARREKEISASLTDYHRLCSQRGAKRIADSLQSSHSLHIKSKKGQFFRALILCIVNAIIFLFLFFKRLFLCRS